MTNLKVETSNLLPTQDALSPVSFTQNPAQAPTSGTMPFDPGLPDLTDKKSVIEKGARVPGPWCVIRVSPEGTRPISLVMKKVAINAAIILK